ncbi:MAG: hypothetical protein DMG59_17090, partial [Acidobacteria bacterium]
MRYLLVLAVLSRCVSAQSSLTKTLIDELDRNFNILKQKGDPPPYFMAYQVTEAEGDFVIASRGSLDIQNHSHQRMLDVTIRVGCPKFDNYRRVGADRPRFTAAMPIALDDNAAAIRQSVWLSTDRAYRRVSQRLLRIKGDEKLRAGAIDGSDDFSSEDPQVYFSAPPPLKFNANQWAERLRK